MSRAAATEPVRASRDAAGGRSDDSRHVAFRVDGQLLGIHVFAVQEVLPRQPIARVPRAPSGIAGLLNLRGQIVTAVDLRQRLGLPERGARGLELASERGGMNVVVREGQESFSLLVDEVDDVIDVAGRRLEPLPSTLDARWKAMTEGVYRLETGLLVVLNVAAVLRLE